MGLSTNMRILVVDDFATMRRIIKNIFKQVGVESMEEAEDGDIALSKLKVDNKFDLVVTDWNMPNMSGLELLKAIRSEENLKHLPVLMVTAEASKDNILEAAKAGVTNYIVKPFTADTLKEKLEAIFK